MAAKHHRGECDDPECGHRHGKQSDEKKEQLQKRYMEFQILNHQIKEMQKQIQTIDAQVEELENTSSSIEGFSKTSEKADMFVTLSPGVFAKAELKDNKTLLINVGASTAVQKKAADVKKMVDNQISELKSYRDQAMMQIEIMVNKARDFENGLKELVE
ncbi:prefoldin subunit alpha [Candidatus Woesearchaeota archaeon CG10_big_fil_rev_8_21_14_0_10_44_13]|nr:MAG: prefoldin subunit alpha [Candidatus Woesearchaeota archaeon CG10_big_fil_rev_8_21_14_0_10_44_13]